jgi:hypothetical protein
VTACAASGIGAFLVVIYFDEGLPPRFRPVLYWAVCFLIVCTPLGPVVLLTRRRFMRLAAGAQRRLAVAVIAAIVAGFLAFTWGIIAR